MARKKHKKRGRNTALRKNPYGFVPIFDNSGQILCNPARRNSDFRYGFPKILNDTPKNLKRNPVIISEDYADSLTDNAYKSYEAWEDTGHIKYIFECEEMADTAKKTLENLGVAKDRSKYHYVEDIYNPCADIIEFHYEAGINEEDANLSYGDLAIKYSNIALDAFRKYESSLEFQDEATYYLNMTVYYSKLAYKAAKHSDLSNEIIKELKERAEWAQKEYRKKGL